MVEQVADEYYYNMRGNEKYDNLRGNETYPIAHIVSSNIFHKVLQPESSPFDMFSNNDVVYNSQKNLNLIQYIREEMKNGPSLFIVSI